MPHQKDCLLKTCNHLITKILRLAAVRCPAGLAFDIFGQTCNWKAKVDNCDRLSSKFRNHTNFTITSLHTQQHNTKTDRRQINNDICSEAKRALPNLKTDEPVCPDGQLQCGNGESQKNVLLKQLCDFFIR